MAMGETAAEWFEGEYKKLHFLNFMHTDGPWRKAVVYCLICRDGGPAYVKFGFSAKARKRLDAISTGCPIPPRYLFVLGLSDSAEARSIEARAHETFSEYRIRGEWFKFDLDNPAHKADFHRKLAELERHVKTFAPDCAGWIKCKISGNKIVALPLKSAQAA